jgi:regulator of RNase E activity RraA
MVEVTQATLDKLRQVSTATLTTLLFKRGLRNQFIQGVRPLNPATARLVGPAYTLRHIPAREDLDTIDSFKNRENPQRKAVEDIPAGHVLVMDCRGDARAASAGGILITRLMMRGCAGVVSDGGIRDSHEVAAMAIPVHCKGSSAPTNLTRHHPVDIGLPIACGEAPVFPGDIMVGDEEGVVVIPRHLAAAFADEAVPMTWFEDFVMEEVRAGRSTFGLYPPTDPETPVRFEAWKKARGLG